MSPDPAGPRQAGPTSASVAVGLALIAVVVGSSHLAAASAMRHNQDQHSGYRRPKSAVAIVRVTVVPMDQERLLADHTVVIERDRMVAVGPTASTPVPAGARVIDGVGRYLTPGLADMHVHLTAEIGARPEFGDGPLFLAAGVTTVLNLRGDSTVLAWRGRVKAGELLGPTVHTSGEFVNEPRVNTPEEAAREVRAQAEAGYDVIKFREVVDPARMAVLTTTGLPLPAYRRMMETARELGIPVIGHVPANLGNEASIEAGQSWAHLYTIAPLARRGDTAVTRIAAEMGKARIWVTPTLSVYRAAELTQRPGAKLVSENARGWWDRFVRNARPGRDEELREMRGILQRAVLLLHRAGVQLLAGTDALGWPFMIPGSGLHEELRLLREAGLSPFEALRAATVEPARFLGKPEEFGTIAVGRRADLLLVKGNPLEDLGTLERPDVVMTRGILLDQSELQTLVERLASH